ncbi:hypothetical protein [Methyloglobulus sp.]
MATHSLPSFAHHIQGCTLGYRWTGNMGYGCLVRLDLMVRKSYSGVHA